MSEELGKPRVIELSGTLQRVPFGPTTCAMPDLSLISHKTMLDYILNATFRGAGAQDQKVSAYLRGFILVTDKAIFEYQAARAALQEFVISRNKISLYIRTCAHLETCIHSVRRALRFVDRLKPSIGHVLDRADWKVIQRQVDSIRAPRNILEHMDDEIATGRFTADGYLIALALSPNGDAASIGNFTITFTRLSMLLKRLHALAKLLSDYRDPLAT
jgi:hypothetical protein